jgi:hypothetical protein
MLPDPAPSHSIRNWDVVFSTPEPLMCRFAGGGIADYTFYFEQNSQPVPINLNLLAYRTWTETVSATLNLGNSGRDPEPDTWISTGGMLACFGLKIR